MNQSAELTQKMLPDVAFVDTLFASTNAEDYLAMSIKGLDLKTLGLRISEERIASGLSVSDLEKKTGISRGIISRVEDGDEAVSIGTIVELAEALNISLAQLLNTQPKTETNKDLKTLYFPQNLKRLTEERGVTRADLAKELGVEYKTIGGYFSGHRFPSPKRLKKLAEFLKVHPKVLWADPKEPASQPETTTDANVDLKKVLSEEIQALEDRLGDKILRNIGHLEGYLKSLIKDKK